MPTSLYNLSISSYLQALGAVSGFLAKGEAHCREHGPKLDEIVTTRLHPDMLPFRFQLVSVVHQSLGVIHALQSGVFHPPATASDHDYAGLQQLVRDARSELEGLAEADIDALAGRTVQLEVGEMKLPFTAEDFVLSFSLPNLYFHAATAYDILRMKGVPLGKGDFLGSMRMKGA